MGVFPRLFTVVVACLPWIISRHLSGEPIEYLEDWDGTLTLTAVCSMFLQCALSATSHPTMKPNHPYVHAFKMASTTCATLPLSRDGKREQREILSCFLIPFETSGCRKVRMKRCSRLHGSAQVGVAKSTASPLVCALYRRRSHHSALLAYATARRAAVLGAPFALA